MTEPAPAAIEMLLRLRRDYLQGLPEKLDRLEALLLAAETGNDPHDECFADFYRQVHSLKGSGGTYGLHILSSICHQLEDLLQLRAGNPPRLDAALVAPALAHVDLLREAVARAGGGHDQFTAIEQRLGALRTELFPPTLTALVVLPSRATAQLCLQVLAEQGFRSVPVTDGYAALWRALTEPVDVLVTSAELPVLNGAGLLAAVRLSSTGNRRMRCILISASGGVARNHRRLIDPDYVIARDTALATNLEQALGEIRATHAAARR